MSRFDDVRDLEQQLISARDDLKRAENAYSVCMLTDVSCHREWEKKKKAAAQIRKLEQKLAKARRRAEKERRDRR